MCLDIDEHWTTRQKKWSDLYEIEDSHGVGADSVDALDQRVVLEDEVR